MNTNVTYGTDLKMPSGCEVGAASFHGEVVGMHPIHAAADSGMKAKLEHLRERSLARVHEVQRTLADRSVDVRETVAGRTALVRSNVQNKLMATKSTVRRNVDETMARMENSMRMQPMKWASIAAASGFALGMAGRVAQWRSKQKSRYTPQLVIIETSC
jgi:ElaB/YqjD/DUF883 family membrane-anchored ribosome-binding protein